MVRCIYELPKGFFDKSIEYIDGRQLAGVDEGSWWYECEFESREWDGASSAPESVDGTT